MSLSRRGNNQKIELKNIFKNVHHHKEKQKKLEWKIPKGEQKTTIKQQTTSSLYETFKSVNHKHIKIVYKTL